ncbi:MAG TPA: MqnA/MqnD/SBP family protein [Candidatus Thermoplasmatota archaeon]|nr:MqnA/MqnD/SBP family protein [Candidatus Thermoplasmatota archaeon]
MQSPLAAQTGSGGATTPILSVGHSPDPDDAFMVYGLAKGKTVIPGTTIRLVPQDIETLNRWAFEEHLDVTAMSAHAYARLSDKYALLAQGSSFGDGYGPLVVARPGTTLRDLGRNARIAIPGELTSAYLAARLALSDFTPISLPFDRILAAVARRDVQAGLIIHEGQLTYAKHGVEKLLDLGAWWKRETGLLLPLGVNAIRKRLDPYARAALARAVRESLEYGLTNRKEAIQYAQQFGRGIDAATADRFVDMYVNAHTRDLREPELRSLQVFFQRAYDGGYLPRPVALEVVRG